MAPISLEKLLEIIESKDKKVIDEIGGVQSIAESLGSDVQKGLLTTTEMDLEQRKLKYGCNTMERKSPPSIFKLFWDAMQDTTIIVLLIASLVSVIIGTITCVIHLGKTCPRRPLWDIGYIAKKEVRFFVQNYYC
jgi:magnesium-transporting ATPase (P-type)